MDLTQTLLSINYNEKKYNILRDIESILIQNDGIIFGGYVRDKYIHDYYAYKFYSNELNDPEKYSDPEYDPETKLRLLVPNDIDVYFDRDEVKRIMRKNGYMCVISGNGSTEKSTKYAVWQKMFPEFTVYIDVLPLKEDEEINVGLDLLCNSLAMNSKRGIWFSNYPGSNLFNNKMTEHEILNSIIKLETRITASNLNDRKLKKRVYKMMNRGWTINNADYSLKYINNKYCNICGGEVEGIHVQYKDVITCTHKACYEKSL